MIPKMGDSVIRISVELIYTLVLFRKGENVITVLIVDAESHDVHLKTTLVVHHRFGLYGVQSSVFSNIASKIHLTMYPS